MSRRLITILAATAVLVVAGILLLVRGGPTAPLRLDDGGLPNVLLITVDTLRGDHVGYDGHGPRDLTPALDRFASQGTAFLAATTPAPATRPAMASLFTGTYPGKHGITNNSGKLVTPQPVLAELLRKAGYRTAGFYGNLTLSPPIGFHRGFDSYDTFATARSRSKDVVGVDLARQWLENPPESPWFLWVHLMDPHGPYHAASPETLKSISRDDALPEKVLERSRSNFGLGVLPRYQWLPGVKRASEYRHRYRGDVRHSDEQLGELLDALDQLGLAQSTLVVVTADHGESLGENDYYFQHGSFPYESSVHVPLLFRLPERIPAGVRQSASVSLVDVLPTLLGGIGVALPPGVEGRDLSADLANGEASDAPAFSVSVRDNQISAVRVGRWKLVHTPRPPRYVQDADPEGASHRSERFELFDLEKDPTESRDLAAQQPERLAEMRALLARWEAENGVPRGPDRDEETTEEVSPELREHLRALGYLD